MNKDVTGVGSASILLVFTVLCLTIFAFISFETAETDKAMADKWAETVAEYYAADTIAEGILAEMLEADAIPAAIQGVDIITEASEGAEADTVCFYVPISELKELYVRVAIYEDHYETLEWIAQDVVGWEIDEMMPIWLG